MFPTASGPTGGIERFSPNVPPPPMVREVRSGVVAPPVGMGAGLSGKELAQGGALAASNAAAGAAATSVEGALAKPAAKGEVRAPREVLELIWYDPAALPRIRRNPQWKKIIAELKPRLSDDDFDGGLPPEQMKAAKDRRDVFGVLARGEVINLAGIQRAMDMAVLEDGSFVPPYVLTAGTLELLFDEMDTLKATMVAVAPFVPIDKKLKEVLDYVNEVIRTPGIERARGVMEGLCAKVRVTFGETARGVSKGYLDEQIEPMLLEGRCYQKQIVTGKSWIKATLTVQGATGAIPVSLAEASTSELPMSRRFQARLLVEARNKAAGGEPHGISLRTIATGHRLP